MTDTVAKKSYVVMGQRNGLNLFLSETFSQNFPLLTPLTSDKNVRENPQIFRVPEWF